MATYLLKRIGLVLIPLVILSFIVFFVIRRRCQEHCEGQDEEGWKIGYCRPPFSKPAHCARAPGIFPQSEAPEGGHLRATCAFNKFYYILGAMTNNN